MPSPTSPSVFSQAERELGSFRRAVQQRFGPDVSARATEYWFAELDRLPLASAEACDECFDFRLVTVAAAVRLAQESAAASESASA